MSVQMKESVKVTDHRGLIKVTQIVGLVPAGTDPQPRPQKQRTGALNDCVSNTEISLSRRHTQIKKNPVCSNYAKEFGLYPTLTI